MTHDEDLMVRFALKWLPYGGGDEHILPEFGLMPDEFYRRLSQLMDTVGTPHLDPGSRRRLSEFSSLKLARPAVAHARRRHCAQPDPNNSPAHHNTPACPPRVDAQHARLDVTLPRRRSLSTT